MDCWVVGSESADAELQISAKSTKKATVISSGIAK